MSTGALMFIFEEFRVPLLQVRRSTRCRDAVFHHLDQNDEFRTQRWRYLYETIESIPVHPTWVAYCPACRETAS